MHNKFCIDDNVIINGSFHWSYKAKKIMKTSPLFQATIDLLSILLPNFAVFVAIIATIKKACPFLIYPKWCVI